MTRRILASVVLFVALSAGGGRPAKADVNLHMRSPTHCTTDGGTRLDLPPGFFLDEEGHAQLDAEVKRLQEAEMRLTAENGELRALTEGHFGTMLLVGGVVLVIGVAAGVTIGALYF